MKRILIYIVALGALLMAPVEGADIGKLHPVEVVFLCREGDTVILKTDTEDVGKGTDALSALKSLKETTPGIIYLDTAEYLLMESGTEEEAEKLRPVLKKRVRLCYADKEVKPQDAAVFLDAHGKLPQLKEWKIGQDLPKLTVLEKRLKLS